jgi:7-cyano-7-deazaguanine synthase
MTNKTVAIVSGGMDSVVMAHLLASEGHQLTLMSFDYGQRHKKELEYAKMASNDLGANHVIVDLSHLTGLISSSSLTNSEIEVPDGHYAEQTMKQTVVPNRNAIMLNIAAGYAVAIGARFIATAVHGGDHYIYPDCRPAFIKATDLALTIANEGFIDPSFRVIAPFLYADKTFIASEGHRLGVDFSNTWSCYKGGDIHCGSCGTCFERREAMRDAGVPDPTLYQALPEYVDPR